MVMSNVYDFNRIESHLIGQVFHKKFEVGQTIRGETYLKAVENMLKEKLITLTPLEKLEKGRKIGYKMHLTKSGKEAWINFGRKAAGKPPI